MLDPAFVADCPYRPEAILFDEILEIDGKAGRLVARMPTHDRLPLTDLQRAHPVQHPRHVSGALMVHVTGMLGFAHAYFVLGLRHADGWIGYGTHIHAARYGALATVGPPILLECRATQVRRIRGSVYVRYAFRFVQDGTRVYESEQGAVWRRESATTARDAAGNVPDEIMGMARAFMESRVLLTALELDLFTALGGGATAVQAAASRGTDGAATARLLNALVALGLLVKNDEVFSPTPVAAQFLARGGEDDSVDALLHQSSLWKTWSGLTEAVRTGRPAPRDERTDRGRDRTLAFIAAMHRGAAQRAPLLVRAVGAEGVRRLLDVGGGSGAYSIAFARANPSLGGVILDLPTVLPIADGHLGVAGLTGRIATRAGDLRHDDLGSGFDLVLLSSICHMLDREENRDLLRRAFAALSPGGRVVISDFLLAEDRAWPRQAALFSINMLVGTPSGDCYTEGEYAAWLREAGFGDVVRRDLPGPASLVIGTRPAEVLGGQPA